MNDDDAGAIDREMSGVRGRLAMSFGAALAFGAMAGPYYAVSGLLDGGGGSIFFWPSRYMLLNTAVSAATSWMVVIAGIPLLAITVWSWRRFGAVARWAWFVVALGFVGLLGLNQKGMLPIPGGIIPCQGVVVEGGLGMGLAWAVTGIFFRTAAVQYAAYPLLVLHFILKIAGLADLTSLIIAGAVVVWGFGRYKRRLKSVPAEAISAMIFVVVPLMAFFHFRVSSYVFALDAPYSLALLGIFGVTIAGILSARNIGLKRSPAMAIAALVIFCGITAAGGYWSQCPRPVPEMPSGDDGRPNIVLIVWDTARAAQFSQYGYEGKLTPGFGEVAERGVLFERLAATSCWTLPTHASMFTGLWPREHAAAHGGYPRIREGLDTITELLSDAGYETVGLTANHSNAGTSVALD